MKKKKKTKRQEQSSLSSKIIHIDEKRLAYEIIQAYEALEHKKTVDEEKRQLEAQKEWKRIVGQKEYLKNESCFWKIVHRGRNDIVGIYKLLTFKKKDVRDPRAIFELMKTAIMAVFSICKWTLYIMSLSALLGAIQGTIELFLGISVCIVFWMFARLFRIASFEAEKLQNNDMLISIFSGVISFAAVVIAIAAIVIDKIQ